MADAIADYRSALERLPSPDVYGARFVLEYGWARVLMTQHRWRDARVHWLNALQSPTRRPTLLPLAYLHLAEAAKKEGDLRTMRRAAEGAISADAVLGGREGVLADVQALDPDGAWITPAAQAQQ